MTFLAKWLISKGLSACAAKAIEWSVGVLLIVLALVAALMTAAHLYHAHDDRVATEAVTSHDKDITIEAANIVMAADRQAAANQVNRDAAFTNSQNQAKEAVNEAQRTHTSPLDAAFDKLR